MKSNQSPEDRKAQFERNRGRQGRRFIRVRPSRSRTPFGKPRRKKPAVRRRVIPMEWQKREVAA